MSDARHLLQPACSCGCAELRLPGQAGVRAARTDCGCVAPSAARRIHQTSECCAPPSCCSCTQHPQRYGQISCGPAAAAWLVLLQSALWSCRLSATFLDPQNARNCRLSQTPVSFFQQRVSSLTHIPVLGAAGCVCGLVPCTVSPSMPSQVLPSLPFPASTVCGFSGIWIPCEAGDPEFGQC